MNVEPGAATPAGAPALAAHLRWILPAALLAVETLTLSLLVDLPTRGPAMPLVDAVRIVVPVILGAAVAGWLVARTSGTPPRPPAAVALPPWRPLPALALQPVAFTATAALAVHLLAPAAPRPDLGGVALLLGGLGLSTLLALASAAPLPWLAREALGRWRAPLLALGLGLLVWRAAMAAEQLWGSLSFLTLHAAAWVLRLLARDPVVDAGRAVLGLRGFAVHIAPVCSGADGVGLVVIFELVWLALARERLRVARALWLLPAGIAAALLANVLRISSLVLLGAAGHEELALGAFHSKAGWLLFVAIALGAVAVAERLPWLGRPARREPRTAVAGTPEVAMLAPLLATVAAALLTGIGAAGPLDRAYVVRIAAGAAVLFLVRRSLPSLRPTRSLVPAALGLLVGVLWVVALRAGPQPLAGALAALGGAERATWIAVRALGSVLVIPVVEELAFRGFLLGWLSGPRPGGSSWAFPWAAVLLSSLAFGAMHASFAAGTLAGLGFAAVRVWRDRVGDAVVAHAVANAVVALVTVLWSRWELWL